MCFGGGSGSQPYDAFKSGDYQRWLDMYSGKGRASGYSDIDPQALTALETKIAADPNANMQMREVKRQHDVGVGRENIDNAFGQFDSNYYDKYKGDYTGYYDPQIDSQYGDAVGKLTATLAGKGILGSNVGANAIGRLSQENDKVRTNVANEAQDAANKLHGNVEQAKSNLYNLNESSADPQSINARAVGEATALVAPPTYSPIGKVFADFLSPWLAARQNAATAGLYSPYKSPISRGGSGRVVG